VASGRGWPRQHTALVRAKYASTPTRELAARVGRSVDAVYQLARALGLKKSRACVVAMASRSRRWSPAQDLILRFAYADVPTATIAGAFGMRLNTVYNRAHRLGLHKSLACVAEMARKNTIALQAAGKIPRYPKGHVPANKGLRRPGWGPGRMKQTQFKKGQKGARYMPIGSTRLIDGYVYRKVADTPHRPYTDNWKPEHHLVWKRAGRRIPRGHVLTFRDGNTQNTRLRNLRCVPRSAVMRRNTVHNLPPDLKNAVYAIGTLKAAITKKRKKLAARAAA
jgi:hypothetical protein